MEGDRLLLSIAVVAVVVSIAAAGFTYFSVANFAVKLSGYATGEANLTVETSASINFTTDSINWGSGKVDDGQTLAYLDTLAGSAVNSNWTNVSTPLVLENIGNVNVTLNLSVGKNAAAFLGGTSPAYLWNVSDNEASSCLNASQDFDNARLGIYANPNTTTAEFCNVLQFADGSDTIRIHFNLSVPSDSATGALGDVITATAVAS